MTDNSPSRTADKIVIRVPDGLRERVALRAKENDRSVNAELVELLEHAYPELTPMAELISRSRKILDRIEANPDRVVNAGVRWSLVSLVNNSFDIGLFEGDTGYLDFEREMDR